MEKRYYKNLKLIVCVGKDNLIGDRTPDENSNGMLWHIKEELIYFKNKTIGNTVLFGGTTAKYVPIELMKKNREVITLHRNMDIPKLIEDLTLQNKTIFVAGGYSIYKYFLDNFPQFSQYSYLKDYCLYLKVNFGIVSFAQNYCVCRNNNAIHHS